MQENGGGNSDVINAWYTNLAKYSGKFYVLINGGTFSSAVLVSELLAANGAILAGHPSGLGKSGYGDVVAKTIGGLLVQTSTVPIASPNGRQARALIRQIAVPITLYDVWHHINPVTEWLLHGMTG